ncbi:MAG: hypothetical protein HQL15_01205 [Candidatus Omnitrophica bacterium]|nr:hypothetical protein [Candidatus Omnitrophota bacterium]
MFKGMKMSKKVFVLILLILSASSAQAAIEIYSGGKRFSSFEDYQKTGQKIVVVPIGMINVVPQGPMISPVVVDDGQQKLSKMSYNNAVQRVVIDFQQNWQHPKPKFIGSPDELQYALQEAMEHQKEPAILISDPKKLRIVTYDFKKTPNP